MQMGRVARTGHGGDRTAVTSSHIDAAIAELLDSGPVTPRLNGVPT
jgi:hypothetical protein